MKKNEELKQSKISRHEIAKEKFRFFERSTSCKSLNNKNDFVPPPGQFAIVSDSKKKQTQSNQLPSISIPHQKQQRTQKSLKFTTNLKLITRQRSPSRVSQLLNETVNRKIDEHRSLKKITKSESTGNLRPLTALSTQLLNDLEGKDNLKDSKMISNAADYDKKYYLRKQFNQGNTFMVKSRTNIPKHAYGYKSIKLTPGEAQNRLKLDSEPKNQNNRKFTKFQRQTEGQMAFFATQAQPNFLPIEYYMIGDQKPEDMISKYKLQENFMVGYSKWQNLQGNFEWKKCRVIDYIKDKERWEIQWLHNGKRKVVARNNLFFEKQNFQNFQKIISDAEAFRKHSEVYMKYNWIIDDMKTSTHTLEEHQLNKIMKLVTANVTITFKSDKPIETLVKEVKEKYIRANHIVQFNASLPFNVKHKQEFMGYLPGIDFLPNASMAKFDLKNKRPLKSEQKISQTNEVATYQKTIQTKVHPSYELKKLFETSSKKFQKTTSLSSINRIHIIEYLNKSELQIHEQKIASPYDLNYQIEQKNNVPENLLKFYSFSPNKMYDLSDMIVRIDNSLFESIAKLNNIVCEVEYFVGKELDPIYLEKKSVGSEAFDEAISGYRKFLASVNMRIESMGRELLFGMLKEFESLLKIDHGLIAALSTQQFYLMLEEQKSTYNSMKLNIKLEIKGENVQATPKKQQITQTIKSYIKRLVEDFSQVSCITKSYIQQLRYKNKMKISESLEQTGINNVEWKIHRDLIKIEQMLEKTVEMCDQAYERFYQEIKKVYERILSLQSDIKRKTAKKSNFSDVEEYETTIKQLSQNLTRLRMLGINSNMNFKSQRKQQQQPQQLTPEQQMARKFIQRAPHQTQVKFIKVGMFSFNVDDCITKCQTKLYEISYELYKLVLEKIVKENERMEKQIEMINDRLEKQPLDIKQMIGLEQYIHEQASEELLKISTKISELQQKFTLIQKLNIEIEYKDYYECHKIYVKPLKIRAAINGKLKEIEGQYRKRFGEDLVKEIGELTQEIREIEDKFYQSIFIKSIEEMDSSFIVFSKLKQRIQTATSQSTKINQYETAMKWINTNFTRITQIKAEFMPFYQLISLQKNFRFHIYSQLSESLHTIDAARITQDVLTGCDELVNLEVNVFYNNPTIHDIVKQVARSYVHFRDKLPLIQILRNTDLRERHWNSIKELTGFTDILSDKITFHELQLREIKKMQKKLIEISHIATRELIYEKRLNKMKKQWKQLKIHMRKLIDIPAQQQSHTSQSQNDLKVICNLEQIQTKTQNDIYQIQQILSSSFIKFLEKDIVNWRNFTLYKMYEFIEIWKMIEKQIVQMFKMFSKQVMKNQASAEYQKFKVLEKNWKNITCQIEQQPNILELLQTKINDSLKYTVELIEDLKKSVSHFFQKKKQRFSRFGALSQQELISLYSNSNDQKQVFDQALRKCLHGVKNVVRDESKLITCIKTHLDEQIQINGGSENTSNSNSLTPDRAIEDIEKMIKKSLRTSIDSIDELRERSGKILQIVLFQQRIIFTREVQNQLIETSEPTTCQKGIKQGYLNALLSFKQKIIQALLVQYQKVYSGEQKGKKEQNIIKIQTQLNQLINHIQIAEHLYMKNVFNLFDFEWVSQIRTYQKANSYSVEIGLNKLEYGFEITDQQQYIVENNNAKMFCHLSMALREKMFGLLSGKIGSGKLALFHYLANVHGKNQLILNCHKALSQQNAFDFLRMCANGIWIVFNNINLLSQQVFSCFKQSLQLFWANYPTQKNKTYFMLGDKNITFSTHQIGLFGTINTSKNTTEECASISHKLSNYFRTFTMPSIDMHYLLECKLLLGGFEGLNTRRLLKMIEMVEGECEGFYGKMSDEGFEVYGSLSFSMLNFVEKVVGFAKELKEAYEGSSQVEQQMMVEQGLNKGIEEITRNLGSLKAQIMSRLRQQFDFLLPVSQTAEQPKPTTSQLSLQTSTHEQHTMYEIKKLFTQKKLFPSKPLLTHYFDMLKTLQHKHSLIVLGHSSTGKSLLIDLLQDNQIVKEDHFGDGILNDRKDSFVFVDGFRISLKRLHPDAYSLKELYGDVDKNGVVNCLIKDAYQALQNDINLRNPTHKKAIHSTSPTSIDTPDNLRNPTNKKAIHSTTPTAIDTPDNITPKPMTGWPLPFHHMGLVFDSEISAWIEPLLPLIKSCSNYVQPNGKNIIVEQPLKLIFECRDVSSVSPSIILSTSIVHLEDAQLKWQHVFANFMRNHFPPMFKKKMFVQYCEQLSSFILEPVLDFFKNSLSNAAIKLVSNSEHAQNTFLEAVHSSFLKNEINYIPLVFNLFIALLQDHFKRATQSLQTNSEAKGPKTQDNDAELFTSATLQDKDRSAILNLFLMAITWTIGLFILEESKKTFSRHFKYLIKRSLQLNIKAIDKESLPKDEQDLYEICFLNNKWHLWEHLPQILSNLQIAQENPSNISRFNSEDKIAMKTKIKYHYLLEKYCEAGQPFFVVGKSSSGKNSLMLEFLRVRGSQIYNKILLACTPQTSHMNGKVEMRKQIHKEKYSHAFKGFVHKKMTLFYMCDMNLPLIRNELSLGEFLHEYLQQHGWYLDQTSEFFEFKNIVFCGTLNSSVRFSQNLLKYINPLPYFESQDDIKCKLFSIFQQNEFIMPYAQSIVKLMTNLQQVVTRELKSRLVLGRINHRDMCEIAEQINFKVTHHMFRNVSMESIGESQEKSTKKRVLQCWILETEKKYRERFGSQYEQEKIFYFVNNVLMEEERTRYKNILPCENVFVTNFEYFLGRLRVSEFKSMKKGYKSTRMFYGPSAYKVNQGLESVGEEIEALEMVMEKDSDAWDEEGDSLAKEIQLAVDVKGNSHCVTAQLRTLTAMLDYVREDNSHLMFFIDDRKNQYLPQANSNEDHLPIDSTLKHLFTFPSTKPPATSKPPATQSPIHKLLYYLTKINSSQLLQYQHDPTLNEPLLQWKLFITQLFELINSPTSSNLHDKHIVYINHLHPSQFFILEELLTLKRTGTLSMLEDYINSEELDLDDGLETSTSGARKARVSLQPGEVEEDSEDEEEGEAKRKKMKEEEKQRKKNTAQLIRDKILSKIKFVLTIHNSQLTQFTQNYSILLQKCHILWLSHLTPSPPNQQPLKQTLKKAHSQNYPEMNPTVSIETSQKSIERQSQKSLVEGKCVEEMREGVKSEYEDQKQSLNGELVSWEEVRDVYLAVRGQVDSKEDVMRLKMEIDLRQNLGFLRFVKLCSTIKQGISSKVTVQLTSLQHQLSYFDSLSTELIPQLTKLIQQKKLSLNSLQTQLNKTSHQIQLLLQQKQTFMSYFVKAEESIALLEKESRQANELYHQYIGLEEKNFTHVQFALVDLLKTAKDRKVVVTNQVKIYIQMFGVLIGKKIKPEETLHKQIVKDMAALKVHKKVSNLLVQIPLGQKPSQKTTIFAEKSLAKLKQFIAKNLLPQFTKRTESKQQIQLKQSAIKQLSFTEGLLILLKEYFICTMAYFGKSQQQQMKALNKKCLKCIKELNKTKDEYQKSLKSKQYQKVNAQVDELHQAKSKLLNSFDAENQLYQKIAALEKHALEVVCLNHFGDLDQKELARKTMDQELVASQLPPPHKLATHILVDRIQKDYLKEQQHLEAINHSHSLIALLLASKLTLIPLKITLETSLVTKLLSKQANDAIRTLKLQTWENCFTASSAKNYKDNEDSFKEDQFAKWDRPDIADYFLKDFEGFKVLELMKGVVLIQKSERTDNWLGKKTSRTLRYDPSLPQRLSTILDTKTNSKKSTFRLAEDESPLIESVSKTQRTISKSHRTISKSHRTINSIPSYPLIITNLTSLHDAEQLLTAIVEHKELQQHLASHLLVVVYEKIASESLQATLNQQKGPKYLSGCCPINLMSLNQNNSEEVRLIEYLQRKIEDELSQEKKESDIKALNKLKELKESQKQNLSDRKTIIKNPSISHFSQIHLICSTARNQSENSRDANLPSNQPLTTTIQQDKYIDTPQVPEQQQKPTHLPSNSTNPQELLLHLSGHLHQLKHNLLEYASINQAVQSLPSLLNSKKKSNIQTTKLIKYIARLYQGLLFLQHQNLITPTLSFERFGQFLLSIVQKEKETLRAQYVQTKLFKQIKNKIWEHFLLTFNSRKLFIGLVFALAGHDALSQLQHQKLLKLLFRLYTYAIKITHIDQQLWNLVNTQTNPTQQQKQKDKSGEKHPTPHLLTHLMLKPASSKQQKPELSPTFQQLLDLISQTFSCFTELKHNIKRKLPLWIDFIKHLQDKFTENTVNTLPEPYNDINRAYFAIFVALTQPQKLQKWIDLHLHEQDLTKLTQFELISNQSRLLQLNKSSYKQTILLGHNALSLLSSLSLRTKKTLKLYSKVGKEPPRRPNELSHRNSPALTRKQIPLNQMSYFANRKLEQQFVQEMYQSMKNSHWLVIDCDNLINPTSHDSQTHKLQTILKLIDLYTSTSQNNQNEEEQSSETHANISESSQNNVSAKKINKTQINFPSLQTCDYHIFFVLSEEHRQYLHKSTLLHNHRRCLIEITPENDAVRCLQLTKLYHQDLVISKKSVKDYEVLDFSLKLIVFYALKAMESALSKIIKVKIVNQIQLNSLAGEKMTNFVQIRQMIDKLSKTLVFILQDPQYLLELLNPNKKIMIQPPAEEEDDKQDTERQEKPERQAKNKNQVKTNSRFQKQRSQARKKTLKLTVKPSINEQYPRETLTSAQKQVPKINISGKQHPVVKTNKKLQNKKKYLEVTQLLKLFHNYLISSLSQTHSTSTGFDSVWKNFTEEHFVWLMAKYNSQMEEKEYGNQLEAVLIGDPDKAYTSNKSILEDLLNFMNITAKEQQKHASEHTNLRQIKNSFVKSQLMQFQFLDYHFADIRLFVQRLLDGFKDIINEENFNSQIQAVCEIKKKCESESAQLKKHLLPPDQLLPPQQNPTENKFNFSSLTENLTVEQMRNKLSRKSNQLTLLPKPSTHKQHYAAVKLKQYLWKKNEDHLQGLEKKLSLLRALKSVLLLDKINYHCMWEMWKKNNTQYTLLSLVQTLIHLNDPNLEPNNHATLNYSIDFFRKVDNLSITSFFSHSLDKPVPVIDLQTFKQENQLTHFIQLLKDVFVEVNKLKDRTIRHHFVLQYAENHAKNTIQHPLRLTNMYKISEFQGFAMFGCNLADDRLIPESKSKVVLALNNQEQQSITWPNNEKINLKLVMYFEEADDFSDSDVSDVEQGQENEQKDKESKAQSKQQEAKTSKCKLNFFQNKMTLLKQKPSQTNDSMISKVEVDVLKRSKFWDKGNLSAYIFY